MHELSITESVVAAVTEKLPDTKIAVVTLEIGRLSGVVPDSVKFCFEVCTRGTDLEDAVLEVIEMPGSARCRACGADLALDDLIPLCDCGSAEVDITGGEELRIKHVKVA